MSEINNAFTDAIDINSEAQWSITESEWNQIRQDKTKILSNVSDTQKEKFISKYEELESFFKLEWEQIHKITIDELNLLRGFFQTETSENITESKIQQSLEFFNNAPEIQEANILLSEAGLNIYSLLGTYKDYIETSLALPINSKITPEQYSKIIWNIKTLIITRVEQVVEKIKDIKEDQTSLANMWLHINKFVKDEMEDISKILLSSSKFYIDMSTPEFREKLTQTNNYKRSPSFRRHVKSRMLDFHNQLATGDTMEKGEDIPTGLLHNNTFFQWMDHIKVNPRDEIISNFKWVDGMSLNDETKQLDKSISLLNENDKQVEKDMNNAVLWACLISILPGFWEACDIDTILSDQWEFVTLLKKMNVISQDTVIPSDTIDKLIASASIIVSLITVGLAWRAVKLGKFMNKMKDAWADMKDLFSGLELVATYMSIGLGDIMNKLSWFAPDLYNQLVKEKLVTPEWVSLIADSKKDTQQSVQTMKSSEKSSLFRTEKTSNEKIENVQNTAEELRELEKYQNMINNLPPVKEWYMRLYRGVEKIGLELEFFKRTPEQAKLFNKLVKEGPEALTKNEFVALEELLPLLDKWEARYFSTDFKTAWGYWYDRVNKEMWEIFYMDVPADVVINNMRTPGALQPRLWESSTNYWWDAILLNVDDLSKYWSKKISEWINNQFDITFLEKIDFSSIPKQWEDWYDQYKKTVELIASMNNTQRLAVAELILGRSLDPNLANNLLEVHGATKTKVFEHSKSDLKTKLQKSNDLNVRWDQQDQVSDTEFKKLMDWGILGEWWKFNITGIPDDIVKALKIKPRATDIKLEMTSVISRIKLKWDIEEMEVLVGYLEKSWDKYKDIPGANLGLLKHKIRVLKEKQVLELAEIEKTKELAEAKKAQEAAEALLNIKEVSFDNMSDFVKQAEKDPSLLKDKTGNNKELINYVLENLNPDNLDNNFWRLDLSDINSQWIIENLFNGYQWEDLKVFIKSLNKLSQKISNPNFQPDENLLKAIWILDGSDEKSQLFEIWRVVFRWESFITPSIEARTDQLIRWLRTLEQQKIDIQQTSLNNLEKDLLNSLGVSFDNFNNIDLIEKLRNAVISTSNKLEGELLLQILNKLPEEFTAKHLKWYEHKINDRIK